MYRLRRRDSLCPTRKLPSLNRTEPRVCAIFGNDYIIAAALDVHLSAAAAQAVDNPLGFLNSKSVRQRCSHNPCSRCGAIEMLIAAGDCIDFPRHRCKLFGVSSICASLIVTLVDPPSAYTWQQLVHLLNSLLLFVGQRFLSLLAYSSF